MSSDELSNTIIDFQVEHHVNDTELAFACHLSVEKIHAMKIGEGEFTGEEINQVLEYIQSNN
ncbi:LBP_cg2779 family protein [Lactobacillus psittaci]|uniref:XRE family transcriptional regulator n=1 Tax=Lactobacillus psittaci DSM 15354 TaxID=1122152 RepID=A0A0R1S4T0_9LACO|nr:LBP_cg2779 family protein [Lactobacillus psittaci]KRL63641.1 hypothetical protein FC23_GL000550 [Lactobacillus psittaci DSM 15354]